MGFLTVSKRVGLDHRNVKAILMFYDYCWNYVRGVVWFYADLTKRGFIGWDACEWKLYGFGF